MYLMDKSRVSPCTGARAAQVWAAKMLVDEVDGSWVDPQRGRTRMSTIIAAWHEAKNLSWAPSSDRSNGMYIRHRIDPRWGNVAVGKISRAGVQEWVNSLYAEEGLSGKTVRIIYGLFPGSWSTRCKNGTYLRPRVGGLYCLRKTRPGRYF